MEETDAKVVQFTPEYGTHNRTWVTINKLSSLLKNNRFRLALAHVSLTVSFTRVWMGGGGREESSRVGARESGKVSKHSANRVAQGRVTRECRVSGIGKRAFWNTFSKENKKCYPAIPNFSINLTCISRIYQVLSIFQNIKSCKQT